MFTVKARGADGVEILYTCETVTVIGGPNCIKGPSQLTAAGSREAGADPATEVGRDMYREGIFLDREEVPLNPGEPSEPIHSAKHIIQFGGDETSSRQARKGGKVWVMNEQGATVATYDL